MDDRTDCPDAALFMGLLQGDLGEGDRRSLDDHVDACARCAALVVELALLLDANPPSPLAASPHIALTASAPVPGVASTGRAGAARTPSASSGALRPLSASSRLGPWRLLSRLGEGGMGVVYLAERADTGARVALKTLRAVDARLIRGLRQEIRALRRLRHPGVVHVIDDGMHDGVPWIAMELVCGATLQRHLESSAALTATATVKEPWTRRLERLGAPPGALAEPSSPPPSPPARWQEVGGEPGLGAREAGLLGIVAQLCRALAYLHGEGVVHCDLKPSNVLLAGDGRVVLADFGLAASLGARVSPEALAEAGLRDGTALYMCPERIEGAAFDARADLYALGCVMYEILVGQVPFEGTTPMGVLMRHVAEAPVPPSACGVRLPAALEALVLRLLAKRPEDRPGHANVVLEVLSALGVDPGPPPGAPSPRPYLYNPPLSGRGALVEALHDQLEGAVAGRGAAVWLSGESGVGKTRLALELVREARDRNVIILTGQCATLGEGSPSAQPLQAFEAALRRVADRCNEGGAAEVDALLGARGPILAPFAPCLKGLPGQEAWPEPAPLPPEAARRRVFRALIETLDRFCDDRPALLILDDMQWADALSLAALEALCDGGLEARPWLVLAMTRPEEGGWEVARPMERFERLEVERLTDAAVEAMIASMMGLDSAPPSLAAFVCAQAGGNPFFVAEYLKVAVEQRLLTMDRAGRWQLQGQPARLHRDMAGLPVPASIQSLIDSRLDGLRDEHRALCEAAAVLGRDVSISLLAEVFGGDAEDFMRLLGGLRRRQILESVEPDGVRFVHDKLREATLDLRRGESVDAEPGRAAPVGAEFDVEGVDGAKPAELIAARRLRRWHLRAAERLTLREGVEAGRLAWHWEGAGDEARALPCHLEAARRALSRYALDVAEAHYLAALRLFGARRSEALPHRLDLIESVLLIRGDHAAAAQHAAEALADAVAGGAEPALARALRLKGEVLERTGRREEALACLRQAGALFGGLGMIGAQATALNAVATIHHLSGQVDQARALLEEVARTQRLAGDRKAEGIAINDLALVLVDQGSLVEAAALFEGASALFEEVGHRFGVGSVFNNVGLIRQRQGEVDAAAIAYGRALEVFREVGHRQAEAIALHNLALSHQDQRRPNEAAAIFDQVLAVYTELGFKRGQGQALVALANIERQRGIPDKALALAMGAVRVFEAIDDVWLGAGALAALATALEDHGRYEEAHGAALRAVEIFERTPNPRLEVNALALLGWQSLWLGRLDEAAAWLGRASQGLDAPGAPDDHLVVLELAAALARFQGRLEDSRAAATEALSAIDARRPGLHIHLLCGLGHTALAQAGPTGAPEAARHLDAARLLLAGLHLPAGCPLDRRLERLTRALAASTSGRPLVGGVCPEDLPPTLRAALADQLPNLT